MSYKTLSSVAPYYDDFNAINNYLRIMFNPSRAVQARELTQIGTILQNQIATIGSYIFKDNSNVFQAEIRVSTKQQNVQISAFPQIWNGAAWVTGTSVVDITSAWIGKTFQNSDPHSLTAATQTITITGYQNNPGSLPVLFYEFSGANVTTGQVFYDSDTTSTSVGGITIAANPNTSLIAECSQGIIYARNSFVTIPAQQIVLSTNSNDGKTYIVGYTIEEQIVTSTSDSSLLDPANGSSNANAPGADRYQIKATLNFYDQAGTVTSAFLDSFAPFITVVNGAVVDDTKNAPIYSQILDLLAQRTYEINGDFITKPFGLKLKETVDSIIVPVGQTLDQAIAAYDGYDATWSTDSNDYLVAEISAGTAFVRGYEIKTETVTKILIKKAKDVISLANTNVQINSPLFFVANLATNPNNQIGSADPDGQGNSLSGSAGSWLPFQTMDVVNIMSGKNGTGRVISKARLHSVDRTGNTIRIYLIQTNVEGTSTPGSWSSVPTFSATAPTVPPTGSSGYQQNSLVVDTIAGVSKLYACLNDIGDAWSSTVSYDAGEYVTYSGSCYRCLNQLIYSGTPLSNPTVDTTNWSAAVTNILHPNVDFVNWIYINDVQFNETGAVQEPVELANFSAARSIVSATQSNNYVNLALDSSDPANPSAIFGSTMSASIYGIPGTQVIKTLPSTFECSVITTYAGTLTGATAPYSMTITSSDSTAQFNSGYNDLVVYAYVVSATNTAAIGQLIDVNAITTSAGGSNSITLTFPDSAGTGSMLVNGVALSPSDVIMVALKETRPNMAPRTKTLQSISENVSVSSSNQDLYVLSNEDVYQIDSVYQLSNNVNSANNTAAYGGSSATGRLLTDLELIQLNFDNGQRDYYYDYGSISGFSSLYHGPFNNALPSVGTPTVYQVNYRYFVHSANQNQIFFCKSSYPSGTFNDANDDLVNNFQIYRSKYFGNFDLQKCFDFRRKVSDMSNISNNLSFPQQFSNILISSLTHYASRIDKIYVDSKANFGIKTGVFSTSPTPPTVPGNSLELFELGLYPYTFNVSGVAIKTTKKPNYTMEDIGDLERRIENLETYVSMSLLEQNANDLHIVDPATGLDAFKNGIFADPFTDNSRANIYDPHYRITGYQQDNSATTPVEFWNMTMDYNNTSSTTKAWTKIVTLPTTGTKVLCSSLLASEYVNVNPYLFYVWRGQMTLNPAVDTWYDTTYLPVVTTTVGSWDPPNGFKPNPQVDQIVQSWVGYVPGIAINVNALTQVPPGTSTVNFNSQQQALAQQLAWGSVAGYDISQGAQHARLQGAPNPNGESYRLSSLSGSEVHLPPSSTMPNLAGLGILKSSGAYGLTGGIVQYGQVGLTDVYSAIQIGNLNNLFQPNSGGALAEGRQLNALSALGTAVYSKLTVTQSTTTTTTQKLQQNQTVTQGDHVVSTTAEPFMRPKTVQFIATGMRPGMGLGSVTLDGTPVDFQIDSRYQTSAGNFVVAPNGTISGFFVIPPNKFTAGAKIFQIMDDNKKSDGTASPTSGAAALYTSQGYMVVHQPTITVVRSVDIITSQEVAQTLDVQIQSYLNSALATSPNGVFYADPLAQSFLVSQPNGVFLSSLDLYFATKSGDFENATRTVNGQPLNAYLASIFGVSYPKDTNSSIPVYGGDQQIVQNGETGVPLTIYIVTVENGQPTNKVVPFSRITVFPNNINSDILVPSASKTTITWPDPIYLNGNGSEYAIVISSSSKEYNLWTSTLGKQDIFQYGATNPGQGIAQQAYLGEFFESKNGATWVPQPLTNLTFSLSVYQFQTSAATAYFQDSKFFDDISFAGKNFENYDSTKTYAPLAIVFYNWGTSTTGATADEVGFFQNNSTSTIAINTPPVSFNKTTGIATFNPAWTRMDTISMYSFAGFPPSRYGSSVTPIIGVLDVSQTNSQLNHLFSQSSGGLVPVASSNWAMAENNQINDAITLNSSLSGPGYEKIVDNDATNPNNYYVSVVLTSNDSYVSPIIDQDQARAILTRNLVIGVDPTYLWGAGNNYATINSMIATSGLNAAYNLGQLTGTTYNKNDVVFVDQSYGTFYACNATSLNYTGLSGTALTNQFKTDLGLFKWIQVNDYVPPFVDNTSGVGDAGSYVSQTVNLQNPSNTLTVMLDVLENNNPYNGNKSYVNLYYKTNPINDFFVYSGAYTQNALAFDPFLNQTLKMKYITLSGGLLLNADPATKTLNPQFSISSAETTGNSRYKIHVSGASELSQFAEGLVYDTNGNITGIQAFSADTINGSSYSNIVHVFATLADENALESFVNSAMPIWSPTGNAVYVPFGVTPPYGVPTGATSVTSTYNLQPPATSPQELQDFRVWKSNGYIAPLWTATSYSTGDIVIFSAAAGQPYVAYQANTAIISTDIPGTSSKWTQLNMTSGQPYPAFGLNTKPTQLGTAWTEVPTVSIRSVIKNDSYQEWKPMTLRQDSIPNSDQLANNTYYEYTYIPLSIPSASFSSFAIRVDLRTSGGDRSYVPRIKNLRVIATT